MSAISRIRKQKAIWFRQGETYDSFGKRRFHEPVVFDCRWQDVAEEFVDATGSKVLSRSMVFCDREMKVGDILINKDACSAIDTTSPLANEDGYPIRKFDSIPNAKNTETLYIAYL